MDKFAHGPAGAAAATTTGDFFSMVTHCLERANDAKDSADRAHARATTHEATDEFVHKNLNQRVEILEREFRRATYGLIICLVSLMGTIILKGHVF